MKYRSAVFFFALMTLSVGNQSGLSSSPKPSKILEIFTENSGFYFPAGKLLYVSVFSDQSLDYMERGETEMIIQHRRLTSEQMKTLRILLDGKGVTESSGLIFAVAEVERRDYQTNLEVSIQRDGHIQSFTLRGFEQDAGRPFPPDFEELLCFIDNIRNASYRVSSGCRVAYR
ncbi:MAG: hypothetical protein ABR905_13995 [Terracidiphilus sp.]|jgi:hypothetical protein